MLDTYFAICDICPIELFKEKNGICNSEHFWCRWKGWRKWFLLSCFHILFHQVMGSNNSTMDSNFAKLLVQWKNASKLFSSGEAYFSSLKRYQLHNPSLKKKQETTSPKDEKFRKSLKATREQYRHFIHTNNIFNK